MQLTDNWISRWLCWLGLVLLLSQGAAHASAEFNEQIERIEWKKVPIRLQLSVGQEQRVEFPASVKVGLPANLQPLLRTQNVNGTVYLMAHAPFDATRVMVREIDGGHIYLFDITASKAPTQNHPAQVFVQEEGESSTADSTTDSVSAPLNNSYATLTRFAAQQLYAPARLRQERPGIVRTPVARDPIDLVRGGAIDARPLVAWRAGGYYLTAIKLTNRMKEPQILDPRALRGAWLTASFQHHRLLPAGNEADTTAVYLISARPFNVSFLQGL